MELKRIAIDTVPRALDLAQRYRLLNEPEQAASICQDILDVEPENAEALRLLFLATTEQFGKRRGATYQDAEKVAFRMSGEYEKAYHLGMACERWARVKLQEGAAPSMVSDWLHKALVTYEVAEALRPSGNDDVLLRWNACARLIEKVPELSRVEADHEVGIWD